MYIITILFIYLYVPHIATLLLLSLILCLLWPKMWQLYVYIPITIYVNVNKMYDFFSVSRWVGKHYDFFLSHYKHFWLYLTLCLTNSTIYAKKERKKKSINTDKALVDFPFFSFVACACETKDTRTNKENMMILKNPLQNGMKIVRICIRLVRAIPKVCISTKMGTNKKENLQI